MGAFRWSSAATLLVVTAGSLPAALAQPSEAEIQRSHNPAVFRDLAENLDADWLKSLQKQQLGLEKQHLDKRIRQETGLRPEDLDRLKNNPEKMLELLRNKGLSSDMLKLIEKNPALMNAGIQGAKDKLGLGKPEADKAAEPERKQPPQESERPPPEEKQAPPRNDPESQRQQPEPQAKTLDKSQGERQEDKSSGTGRATSDEAGDSQTPRLPVGDKLQGWAERMLTNSQLSDSPAMQNALRSLARSTLGNEDPKWRKLAEATEGFRDKISSWEKSADLGRFLPKEGFHLPEALSPERLGKFSPNRWMERPEGGAGLPQFGTPGASGGNFLTVLAWIVGLGAGAVCLRQLWLRSEESRREQKRLQALRLAWPVDANNVKSREDLVRAFEHLALSNLGLNARTLNHLEIAAGLGQSADPTRRDAVLSLTDTYERARYTPGDEPLSAEMIAEARRHLSVLAGARGA
jgi:hypothetical protein